MSAETDIFRAAVAHWWKSKKKGSKNKSQGGDRGSNLHGKTMDGFAETIRDYVVGLGVKPEHVFAGGHLTKTPSLLPSYFRPSKNWDLVILGNSRFHPAPGDAGPHPILYAAIEFKSQDKSIGNNQNNRLEESIGNAHDFWTTYANSGFACQQPRPWLGYLFVGKYKPSADGKSVKIKQPHFLAAEPFRVEGSDKLETYDGPSYAERYKLFMKQSVGARLYDAGAFIVTDEDIRGSNPNHRIPLPEFGPEIFLRGLTAQLLAHYPNAKLPPGAQQ